MRAPLLTAGIVGGLTIALHFRDPHAAGSWGFCPWHALTGLYCPGCGGLRAVNDLGNGDVLGALSSNLLFVVMVPVLVSVAAVDPARMVRRTEELAQKPRCGSCLPGCGSRPGTVVMLVFGVLRNLPAGSWLAP